MAFHNVTLPDGFDYGSAFGAGFKTIVQETASGHEYRVARQSQPRHRFRLLRTLQSAQEAQTIKDFAIARRGALHSFRLKDLSDWTSHADGQSSPSALDQNIGTGDGSTTDFAIVKNYGVGTPAPYSRVIDLPISGSILVAVDLSSTSAWSLIDGKTIRFDTAPASGLRIDCGFEFDVPVRFEAAFDTWAGLRASGFNNWDVQQLDCVEVLGETDWPETWWPGGSTDHGEVSGNLFLSFNGGQLHSLEATGPTDVYLPNVTRFVPGGPNILSVYVDSGSASTVQIRDLEGNAIGGTHSAGTMVRLALVNDGSSVRWISYV